MRGSGVFYVRAGETVCNTLKVGGMEKRGEVKNILKTGAS